MADVPAVKSSQIQYDGANVAIPGLYGRVGGALPILIETGELNFFDGQTVVKNIPFKCTVIGAVLHLTETLGTAASTLDVGIGTDTDSIVDALVIPTTAVPANKVLNVPVDLIASAADLNPEDKLVITAGAGATTTGKGILTLIVVPRV